ncbi:MAG: hypothetical protein QM296_01155 [Bacillota bacterium]|nr:hypothetical protein [Bacillota bacterium]
MQLVEEGKLGLDTLISDYIDAKKCFRDSDDGDRIRIQRPSYAHQWNHDISDIGKACEHRFLWHLRVCECQLRSAGLDH